VKRVLVIGSGGAGKSTFARRLAQRTGLPLVHLDQRYWRAGWAPMPEAEWRAEVERLVAEERWILDGNFGGTFARRLEACDTVVLLDLPRLTCLWRVLRRRLAHRGRAREDMTAGCPERLSVDFLWWIWRYPSASLPKKLRELQSLRPGQRAAVLRSQREIDDFLAAAA